MACLSVNIILKNLSRSSYLLGMIHFYCISLQVETRSPHSTTSPDYTGSATASTRERAANAGCGSGREQYSALFGWWLKVISPDRESVGLEYTQVYQQTEYVIV